MHTSRWHHKGFLPDLWFLPWNLREWDAADGWLIYSVIPVSSHSIYSGTNICNQKEMSFQIQQKYLASLYGVVRWLHVIFRRLGPYLPHEIYSHYIPVYHTRKHMYPALVLALNTVCQFYLLYWGKMRISLETFSGLLWKIFSLKNICHNDLQRNSSHSKMKLSFHNILSQS